MSVIIRGVKNTFRNGLRTSGFSIIIAVSLSLAFSMLLANQAVEKRSEQLKRQIGATLTVFPAGIQGSEGAGQPLKDADADKLTHIPHVGRVIRTMSFAAQKPEVTEANKNNSNQETSPDLKDMPSINLDSTIDGSSFGGSMKNNTANKEGLPPIPIGIIGITEPFTSEGKPLNLIKGRALKKEDVQAALLGKDLAAKNKLDIGGTFTLKGKTFTVVGIYNSGTKFSDNSVTIPFEVARQIVGRPADIQSFVVTVDELDNLEAVRGQIKSTLGAEKVDAVALQEASLQVVGSLKGIQTITQVALLVALATATLTILLTMLLVVRERTKEIGVLKAIGATNLKIVSQFVTEAIVLTLIGAVIGIGFSALSSNAILNSLVASKFDTPPATSGSEGAVVGIGMSDPKTMVEGISTLIDWHLIIYGLIAAFLVAIIGTIIPAFLAAKVRPAQIMRGNQ